MMQRLQKLYALLNDPLLWEPYTDKLSTFIAQKVPVSVTLKVFPPFIRLITWLIPSSTRDVVPYLQKVFQLDVKAAEKKARDLAVTFQMVSTLNYVLAEITTVEDAEAFMTKHVRYEGLEIFEKALKENPDRSIMVASFHMSALSVVGAAVRHAVEEQRKVALVLYKNAPGVHYEKNLGIAKSQRKKIELIDIENRVALKKLLRMFREDHPVFWITGDLHAAYGETVPCQLFGETFHFASGGMKMAMNQKAKVLVAYLTGVPFKEPLTMHFVDPHLDPDSPATPEGVASNQNKVIAVLEQALKQYPEFWQGWWVLADYKKSNSHKISGG